MADLCNSYEKQLFNAAQVYSEMGWSVIPIMGAGASNPKAAAVKWES
ncbi:MAG: hypothetical protein H7175_09980 [Burkholderiales bacterium]|nr:hypothetical protein [Anaerolineae bacterium]